MQQMVESIKHIRLRLYQSGLDVNVIESLSLNRTRFNPLQFHFDTDITEQALILLILVV
jgi:hypothetical protein